MPESPGRDEGGITKPNMAARFRIVEINAILGKLRVLAFACDRTDAERLCDLHFGELTVRQVEDGYTVRIEDARQPFATR
jgi:hypothetical protein